ncbi:hypothetical protein LRY64_03845, partial [Candidatus Woesebacteria bacterium]|nr:hypothetical protein [Candidatus Woesebacteria bacterium]
MKNIFSQFKKYSVRTFASIALGLSALVGAAGVGYLHFQTLAATEVPGFTVYLRHNSVSAPTVEHIDSVEVGDTIHVYLTVTNQNPANTIDDLQYYAPFAHDGVFAWIEPDDLGQYLSSNTATYTLDNNEGVRYKTNSTKTATNESGDWAYNTIADNSYNESKVFSDSDNAARGFHWMNVQGGETSTGDVYQYTVKYELEVIDRNQAEFNTHSTDEPTFQVRRQGETEWKTSLDGFNAGDILEFKVYVHNNRRGTKALNTTVGVTNWTESEVRNVTLTGFVDADNAQRVTGNVQITDDMDFSLDYIEGSTRFQGWPNLNVDPFDPNQAQADGIVTPDGIVLGDTGEVEGCWDFRVVVYFQAQIEVEPTPTPTPTP